MSFEGIYANRNWRNSSLLQGYGPNFWCAKGMERPEIGLNAIGLDKISGILFLIKA